MDLANFKRKRISQTSVCLLCTQNVLDFDDHQQWTEALENQQSKISIQVKCERKFSIIDKFLQIFEIIQS